MNGQTFSQNPRMWEKSVQTGLRNRNCDTMFENNTHVTSPFFFVVLQQMKCKQYLALQYLTICCKTCEVEN